MLVVSLTAPAAGGSLLWCFGPAEPTHQNDSEEVWLTTGDRDRAVPFGEPMGQDTGVSATAVGQADLKR